MSIRKILRVKRRGEASWQPDKEIDGFREEGVDLVTWNEKSGHSERYPASQYDSWVVEGHIESVE